MEMKNAGLVHRHCQQSPAEASEFSMTRCFCLCPIFQTRDIQHPGKVEHFSYFMLCFYYYYYY